MLKLREDIRDEWVNWLKSQLVPSMVGYGMTQIAVILEKLEQIPEDVKSPNVMREEMLEKVNELNPEEMEMLEKLNEVKPEETQNV